MKILAVGAHPDDVEFYCAGTLAKYKRLGHGVGIAVTTNGGAGSMTHTAEETAKIRRRESEAAARVIGAEFYWMDFSDGLLFNGLETRLKFLDTIRQARPDLVIAHNPQSDYHPDHVTSGQVVWDCRILLTVPNIKTEHPACSVLPNLIYMDTAGGVNFIPDEYVDITADLETKRRMLSCHKSQEEWVRQQYNMPFADFMESFAATRGLQAGCKFAEAFRIPPIWPKATKPDRVFD